jgi:hypothetical protein
MATAPRKEATEPKADAPAPDVNVEPLHAALKEEWEKGYRGTEADPTPNEHYTVAGVTDPDKHVPEEFKVQTGKLVLPDPDYGQK